jgi:hypothetical protein
MSISRARTEPYATTSTVAMFRPGSSPTSAGLVRHKEPLAFEYVKPTQRSYK